MSEQRLNMFTTSRRTVWRLFAVTLLGLAVTSVFFGSARNAELNRFKIQFEHDASLRANLIAGKLEQCILAIKALQGCYNVSDFVERREFAIFTVPFLAEQKELQAMEWIPRVLPDQRANFVETQRQGGLPDFQIKECDANRHLVPADQREAYYPVLYVEPLKRNEKMIGFDLGSEPLRQDTLERARDTGGAAVSGRIQLMQEDKNQSGFIVALPVYKKNLPNATVQERRAALEGFAVGIFWAGDTLASAMDTVAPEGLSFDLLDLSAPKERQLIHHWTARVKPAPSWRLAFTPPPPYYLSKWIFADRQWAMYITPNSAYMIHHYHLYCWLILPAGFGLTFLLGLYLWAILSQRTRMERMVLKRTAELRRYQENLEGLVEERAAELSRTNETLKKEVAERKQTEELLRDSEGRYRAILEASADGILIADVETKMLKYANPAFCRMLGYTEDELTTMGIGDIHPKDALQNILADFEAQIRGNKALARDIPCLGKDGAIVYADIKGVGVTLGGRTCNVGVFRDITERRRAEEILHLSEERLRAMYECSNDAIMLLTEKGFFDCNPRTLELFGFKSKEEFINIHPADISPPTQPNGQESLLAAQEQIQTAYRAGVNRFEWVHYRKNGEDFPAEVLLSAFDYGGKRVLQATVRDITARKRVEIELKKLSVAVEQNPAIIVITDREGNIEYVNPKFSQTTGYTLDEARGKNPRILKSGKTTPEEYQKLWDTILSGREWRGVFYNKKKNGEYYCEQALIAPIKDELGRITNFIAIKEDITERKGAEEALKKAHDDLANVNLELKKASAVKSRFLASMSHEIRTPLNAIIGMTGLLLDTKLDAEQQDCTETVRTSGEMLLALMNNILDFSKLEAEKMDLENQPFDLRQCIEESLDLVNQRAEEKKLEIGYQMQEDLPSFFVGDVTRLRQILVNVLSNAVKFTDQGEVTASVSGEMRDNGLYQLHFVVRDTGLGIPPDRQDRLFLSFSQVDASTSRRFGGTGLGLAISKRLCEMMGGTMWVESSGIPGEGASFNFSVLAVLAPDQSPQDTSIMVSLAGKRVLIVDDNKSNRDILVAQVERLAMRPTAVASGPEALDLLCKGASFDLAFLDLQMPEMDGLTLAEEMKKIPGARSMHLVLLSSRYCRLSNSENARFSARLIKPIKPSQIYNVLCDMLGTGIASIMKQDFAPTPTHSAFEQRYPLRILLAEDNLINQKVALKMLKKMGYRADVASNGLEVLESLRRIPYDVIFMDCQMPEMDGYEATREIRLLEQRKQRKLVYIIAMTAHAMKGDREECLAAGMNDYLSKPVRESELRAAIERCGALVHTEDRAEHAATPQTSLEQASIGEHAAAKETTPSTMTPNTLTTASKAFAMTPDALTVQPDEPLLDLELLEESSEMGAEVMSELVDLYLTQAREILTELKQAIAAGAAENVQQLAHKLAGSSAVCGAKAMVSTLRALEQQGREGRLSEADQLFTEVCQRLELTERALTDYLQEARNR